MIDPAGLLVVISRLGATVAELEAQRDKLAQELVTLRAEKVDEEQA